METQRNNNYAPPKSAVADLAGDSDDPEKASRLSRFIATLVDLVLLNLPFVPSYVVAGPALMALARQRQLTIVGGLTEIYRAGAVFFGGLLIYVVLLVIIAMLVHKNGQSIGKKWLGIKDVRTDGSRASFSRIFWLRWFVNSLLMRIPLIGGFYGLVDALMIFGPAQRCCHDYIADTIVVRA
jgi:uncharacterized RDD family membrane protein YckC